MNVAVRPDHLNILSICTGGGGLDLGVELAIPSARSVCMVEREAFAVAQLVSAMEAGLMAPAPIWSDARTLEGRAWRGAVDGLIGGIPCQPHSLAGKRLGEDDERDLWSTARRIIVQSGAWFVLIENVRGILSSGGAERVWRDLRRLGFQVEGGLFTAAEVGASHERERFFILAVANPDRRQCSWWPAIAGKALGGRAHIEPARSGAGVSGVGQADAYSERLEGIGSDDGAIGRQNARRSIGLCNGTTLDNAISRRRPEGRDHHGQHERDEFGPASEHSLVDALGSGRAGRQEVAQRRSRQRIADERTGGRTLFPPGPASIEQWRAILERAPELEPAFRRVADGLASRLDIARVDRLRMLGNGVVPLQAAYAVRTLVTRLAARGSAGAARLVRLMEIAA